MIFHPLHHLALLGQRAVRWALRHGEGLHQPQHLHRLPPFAFAQSCFRLAAQYAELFR